MPFDLAHVRAIEYAYTPAGTRKLGTDIVRSLTSVLGLAAPELVQHDGSRGSLLNTNVPGTRTGEDP